MSLPDGFFERPFAHRALHGVDRPENSTEAIAAAITAGWAIELDVQLSADRRAVVFHDYDMARLTGISGPVQGRTSGELREIALLGGPSGAPTLASALDQIAGQVAVVIEIKDQDGAMGHAIGPLEEDVARSLADYAGPVAVMSFNPHSVAQMKRLCPHVPRGLTTSAYAKEDWPLLSETTRTALAKIPIDGLDVDFISHEAAALGMPRVAALKANDVSILCWTIRSAEAEAKAREVADQITFEGYTPA